MLVNINYNLVKKQKRLLQISVQELHNDMILPISDNGLFGARKVDGKYVFKISYLGSTIQNILNQWST